MITTATPAAGEAVPYARKAEIYQLAERLSPEGFQRTLARARELVAEQEAEDREQSNG